ncbi:MAG TPA: methylenetetrahydrofolate--tRNA-(uracil(54)-C(5))-methyltransferase (FADH(2)-oxidizing) TrmFO, partial [Thermodesulfobacteriota bacterium]|nr:methylenetetrahydrofolate--tRNA-(uracil(54)-C(5))-methyltransferase (FADH(2)-oxidizing) TrmFO [Thermodesulfobacteriota bacterium]
MQEQPITIIGGGLAGCEAAWQAVRAGKRVVLWEMKPKRFSPAHHSAFLAELVCSNSLRAESLENAVGLLKEEMREMFALFMDAADNSRIPAGGALAVDREYFSARITATLITHPGVTLVREEVKEIPADRPLIIASGPLTADALAHSIQQLIGEPYLSFFDAISPVVGADSINMAKVFWGSRYNRGDSDYLN